MVGVRSMDKDCRIVLVECCEGMRVRPAHGCKRAPVCPCGWIGDYHPSKLMANLEGTAHTNGWGRSDHRT